MENSTKITVVQSPFGCGLTMITEIVVHQPFEAPDEVGAVGKWAGKT